MTASVSTQALHVTFLARHYHATPWGRHVNEGRPDWPPSPWRVLRALVATWHARVPDLARSQVATLMEKLATRPPEYRVPRFVYAHSRHYMPAEVSGEDHRRVLVIDGFVAVDPSEPLVIQWPGVALDDTERATFATLARHLTYLGRAESWCAAAPGPPVDDDLLRPRSDADGPRTRLLAPRCGCTLSELEQDIFAMRKARATMPTSSAWIDYPEPQPSSAWRQSTLTTSSPPPTLALLSLNGPVHPYVRRAIAIGDRLRRALMSRSRGPDGRPSGVFSGRDAHGPLTTGHRHAHHIPFDQRGDGRIDHAFVWAPGGFDAHAGAALGSLRRLFDADDTELRVALVGLGAPSDWAEHPLIGPAQTWISRTPYLLTRYPKKGRDGPEAQLVRDLRLRGLPEPVSIERIERATLRSGRTLRWIEFRRFRGRTSPAIPTAFGFRLHFSEPISGPLALGFGAHFGLGAFESEGR